MAMIDDSFFSNTFEQRLHLILEQRQLRDAMRVLNAAPDDGALLADDDDTTTMLGVFRRRLNTALALALRDAATAAGDDDDDGERRVFQDLRQLVVRAGRETVDHMVEQAYHNAGVEKKTLFHGRPAGENDDSGGITDTGCSICFEEFVDGGQVSVMPCPSRGHRFHPGCISKWLDISSMCPLYRHELPVRSVK